ncbi:MAG: hypothetical protein WC494_02700 [Candidatus Pacearchaeota archaeon]
MKKGSLICIFVLIVILGLNFVVGAPYINADCSDAEIQKVWESVFKESFGGATISKVKNTESECSYYIYKDSSGENYILIGNYLITSNKKTILNAIYINGSIGEGVIDESVSENELLDYGTERNISMSNAENEFNRVFEGVSSGGWSLVEGSTSNYFKSESVGDAEEVEKRVYDKKTINSFYYTFTETITQDSGVDDDFAFKEIGSVYVKRGEEFKINMKIFLKNPDYDGLKYRIVGLKNTSVKFKGDIMTIKWDKNYDDFEKVRVYADNGTKEIRSNEFFIFYMKEDGSIDNKTEEIEENIGNESKEELIEEEKSFNWLVFVIIISCVLILFMILGLVYILFGRKDKRKEDFKSEEVDKYIKDLKIDE